MRHLLLAIISIGLVPLSNIEAVASTSTPTCEALSTPGQKLNLASKPESGAMSDRGADLNVLYKKSDQGPRPQLWLRVGQLLAKNVEQHENPMESAGTDPDKIGAVYKRMANEFPLLRKLIETEHGSTLSHRDFLELKRTTANQIISVAKNPQTPLRTFAAIEALRYLAAIEARVDFPKTKEQIEQEKKDEEKKKQDEKKKQEEQEKKYKDKKEREKQEPKDEPPQWNEPEENYKPENKDIIQEKSDGGSSKNHDMVLTNADVPKRVLRQMAYDLFDHRSERWTNSPLGRGKITLASKPSKKLIVNTHGAPEISVPMPYGYSLVAGTYKDHKVVETGSGEFRLLPSKDVKQVTLDLFGITNEGQHSLVRQPVPADVSKHWPKHLLTFVEGLKGLSAVDAAAKLERYMAKDGGFFYYSKGNKLKADDLKKIDAEVQRLMTTMPRPMAMAHANAFNCDGAAWIGALLMRDVLGHNVRIAGGRTSAGSKPVDNSGDRYNVVKSNDPAHAWIEVHDGHRWIPFDMTPKTNAPDMSGGDGEPDDLDREQEDDDQDVADEQESESDKASEGQQQDGKKDSKDKKDEKGESGKDADEKGKEKSDSESGSDSDSDSKDPGEGQGKGGKRKSPGEGNRKRGEVGRADGDSADHDDGQAHPGKEGQDKDGHDKDGKSTSEKDGNDKDGKSPGDEKSKRQRDAGAKGGKPGNEVGEATGDVDQILDARSTQRQKGESQSKNSLVDRILKQNEIILLEHFISDGFKSKALGESAALLEALDQVGSWRTRVERSRQKIKGIFNEIKFAKFEGLNQFLNDARVEFSQNKTRHARSKLIAAQKLFLKLAEERELTAVEREALMAIQRVMVILDTIKHKDSKQFDLVDKLLVDLPGNISKEWIKRQYGADYAALGSAANLSFAADLHSGKLKPLLQMAFLREFVDMTLSSTIEPRWKDEKTLNKSVMPKPTSDLVITRNPLDFARMLFNPKPGEHLFAPTFQGSQFAMGSLETRRVVDPKKPLERKVSVVYYDISPSMKGAPIETVDALVMAYVDKALSEVDAMGNPLHEIYLIPFNDFVLPGIHISSREDAVNFLARKMNMRSVVSGDTDIQKVILDFFRLISESYKLKSTQGREKLFQKANMVMFTDGVSTLNMAELEKARKAVSDKVEINMNMVQIGDAENATLKELVQNSNLSAGKPVYRVLSGEMMDKTVNIRGDFDPDAFATDRNISGGVMTEINHLLQKINVDPRINGVFEQIQKTLSRLGITPTKDLSQLPGISEIPVLERTTSILSKVEMNRSAKIRILNSMLEIYPSLTGRTWQNMTYKEKDAFQTLQKWAGQ